MNPVLSVAARGEGLLSDSPLAGRKIWVDLSECRHVGCDEEHGRRMKAIIVSNAEVNENDAVAYFERQQPMVCVRHPMVSRIFHALQIRIGATCRRQL